MDCVKINNKSFSIPILLQPDNLARKDQDVAA